MTRPHVSVAPIPMGARLSRALRSLLVLTAGLPASDSSLFFSAVARRAPPYSPCRASAAARAPPGPSAPRHPAAPAASRSPPGSTMLARVGPGAGHKTLPPPAPGGGGPLASRWPAESRRRARSRLFLAVRVQTRTLSPTPHPNLL